MGYYTLYTELSYHDLYELKRNALAVWDNAPFCRCVFLLYRGTLSFPCCRGPPDQSEFPAIQTDRRKNSVNADKKRIWIRGQFVEVTDEVYRAYMQGDRKMRYFENDLKTERFVLGKEGQVVQIIPSREDSLDRLVDENAQQFSDEQKSVESMVLHKLEVDRLHTALSLLAPEERALIQALFFEEKTERQYADELGVYRNAVHVRKMKVLKKLKKILK